MSVGHFKFLPLLLLCISVWATPTRRPLSMRQNSWTWSSDIENLSTSANYTDAGNQKESLPTGSSYSRLLWKNQLSYRPQPRMVLDFGLDFARANSETSAYRKDLSGLSDLQLAAGLDYSLGRSSRLRPGFGFTYPISRVTTQRSEVMLSEGALQAGPFVAADVLVWNLLIDADFGILYRDGGRSSLFTFRLVPRFELARALFGLGLVGYTTISDDQFYKDADRRIAVTDAVDGGSYAFFSVNPSQTAFVGNAEFDITPGFSMRAAVEKTFNGRNSAEELVVKFGLVSRLASFARENKSQRQRRLEKFEYSNSPNPDTQLDEQGGVLPDPDQQPASPPSEPPAENKSPRKKRSQGN